MDQVSNFRLKYQKSIVSQRRLWSGCEDNDNDDDGNELEEPIVSVQLPDFFFQFLHHPFQFYHLWLLDDVADGDV